MLATSGMCEKVQDSKFTTLTQQILLGLDNPLWLSGPYEKVQQMPVESQGAQITNKELEKMVQQIQNSLARSALSSKLMVQQIQDSQEVKSAYDMVPMELLASKEMQGEMMKQMQRANFKMQQMLTGWKSWER